ncbi:MAG: MFS transporter [Leptospiraceae bacterium]|nr:MFS transporter [Leptospiraceae bacterium]MDW7975841.1 MFS transporter [Leptospiraceae bacterium]
MNQVWKLGFVSFFTDISTEMVFPFIGIYLSLIGTLPVVIGFIEGLAESFSFGFRIISGFLSDYTKKRKLLLVLGYGFSIIGKILWLFQSQIIFSMGRLFERFGKGIRNSPRDALISESISDENRGRAFGIHRFLDTLGAFIGVLIAYFVLTFFFHETNDNAKKEVIQALFIFSLIPAVLGFLILFSIKEKIQKSNQHSFFDFIKQSFSYIKTQKKIKLFLIVNFLFALGNSSDQFLFIKAHHLSIQLNEILLGYLVFNLSYGFLAYPAGKLSDKIQRKYVIALGYGIFSITYFFISKIQSKEEFFISMFFYGVYKGLTEGVEKAYLTDIAGDWKASVLGYQSFLYGVGLFFASLIGGIFWNYVSLDWVFLFGSVMALVSLALVLILI